MTRMLTSVVVGFFLWSSAASAGQQLTNEDVVKMARAGLSVEVIVAAVRNAPSRNFDTSPEALIKLKADGVNDAIISAMLSGPHPSPAPSAAGNEDEIVPEVGVYAKEGGQLIEVNPEVVNWRTGGFLKAVATMGMTGGHVNGTVRGATSRLRLVLPLEFVIRCPEGTSAAEYQLLRLDAKRDRREFRAMTGGVIHTSGGAEKNAVEFTFEKVGPATYSVKLTSLPGGEYGFLPPGISSASAASAGKLYTFGVQ